MAECEVHNLECGVAKPTRWANSAPWIQRSGSVYETVSSPGPYAVVPMGLAFLSTDPGCPK